ncbi:MAG: DegV family protein [Dehalococcoidia bacterium]|nr:DegV family protein [Dehalococcoidia bacterium]
MPGGLRRPVRLVTDSTADLPPELASELDITIVPLSVIFGAESFRDGVDLTSEDFFRRLAEASELPTTSQPSVGEFQSTYEQLAEKTDRLLSIHVSSRFSGTAEAARQAAAALSDRCRIEVLDSGTISMAMGFAVLAAARAARQGGDLDECAEAARSVLRRHRLAVALDTLEYLRRGGRIGRAQAFLGGLLRLKPILTIRDGEAHPLARVRTHQKALERMLEICLDNSGRLSEAAVMHANNAADAEFLAREIERIRPGTPVHVGRVGPVIGVHGGPGIVGITVVMENEEGAQPGLEGADAP